MENYHQRSDITLIVSKFLRITIDTKRVCVGITKSIKLQFKLHVNFFDSNVPSVRIKN